MIVTKINTHVTDALNRLLQQYQGLPKIAGLITALVTQIQNLEDAVYPLDQYRQLASAYGQQLDNLGQIIGLERNGLPDNEYFVLLLGEIAQNNSDTTASTMLYIVQTIFQAGKVFIKTPNSPGPSGDKDVRDAAFVAFGVGNATSPSSLDTQIEQIIQASMAAGVKLVYLSGWTGASVFSTAGPQAWCGGCSDATNPQPTDPVCAGLIYNNASS